VAATIRLLLQESGAGPIKWLSNSETKEHGKNKVAFRSAKVGCFRGANGRYTPQLFVPHSSKDGPAAVPHGNPATHFVFPGRRVKLWSGRFEMAGVIWLDQSMPHRTKEDPPVKSGSGPQGE
jgi:hypothetical protein